MKAPRYQIGHDLTEYVYSADYEALEKEHKRLVAIVREYVATAEKPGVKPDLADIDDKARALLQELDQ